MKGELLRHAIPAQPPEDRINNFKEVALGFTPELALAEAERCLNCKNPLCMKGCPVGVHIPQFITAVREGRMDDAAKTMLSDNNLPAVCGRVCPQENQCEKFCIRREKLGGSVAIGALERYVADYAAAHNIKPEAKPAGGAKVAVVGSGPASLSCAADLAKAGVKVTMYEALHKAGGVLVYGIPEFRLPKDIVAREVENLKGMGVTVLTDMVVGKTVMLDELLAGRADVGILRACTYEEVIDANPIYRKRFRVLNEKHHDGFTCKHSTRLYPSWVLAVTKSLSADRAARAAAAILNEPPAPGGGAEPAAAGRAALPGHPAHLAGGLRAGPLRPPGRQPGVSAAPQVPPDRGP